MLFSLFCRSMIIEEEAEKVEEEVSKESENAKEEKVEVEVSKESENDQVVHVRVTVCVADYKQFVNKPLTLDLTTVFP